MVEGEEMARDCLPSVISGRVCDPAIDEGGEVAGESADLRCSREGEIGVFGD